jgi:hypothetical protein
MRNLRDVGKPFVSVARIPVEHLPENGIPAKTTCQCPYCGMNTTVTPIRWTLDKWICLCDNSSCNRTFFADVKYKWTMAGTSGEQSILHFDIIETYPKFVAERHESIPENTWIDYVEASRCFNADSYKATVVMCRRALQNVCLGKGAIKQDANGKWISLRTQLKTVFPQKDYSLIHELSDAIKFLGDYGAHPQDGAIDKVSKEDARTVLNFTMQIFEIAYIQQWKIKKLLDGNKHDTNV